MGFKGSRRAERDGGASSSSGCCWGIRNMLDSEEPHDMTRQLIRLRCVRVAAFCALASVALAARARAEVPVFVISHADSTISFYVRASVDLRGTFDK